MDQSVLSDFKAGVEAFERRDYDVALAKLLTCAQHDHADSEYLLALMYQLGLGVEPDLALARQWYLKAGELGSRVSQNSLADMLYEGQGGPKDEAAAVQWWRRAAEAGFPDSQYSLSNAYRTGRGVEQDSAKATHWLQLAAAQGLPQAQLDLGLHFLRGDDVTQDRVEAYKWFILAALQGFEDAERVRRETVGSLTEEEQIDAAERVSSFIQDFVGKSPMSSTRDAVSGTDSGAP